MADLVTYERQGPVAVVAMDDGKVNALSPAMFTALGAALDEAEADGAVVVLRGNDRVFSAGFSLPVLAAGGPDAAGMVQSGFELSIRLLSFPTPVVIACTGHAIAMGLFVLLSGDHRVGPAASCRFQANEVALGLTMPFAAIEVCRQRLTPAAFTRAVLLSETFGPEEAVAAGILDRAVPADEVVAAALAAATTFAALDRTAHQVTKERLRGDVVRAIRAGIEADRSAFGG